MPYNGVYYNSKCRGGIYIKPNLVVHVTCTFMETSVLTKGVTLCHQIS